MDLTLIPPVKNAGNISGIPLFVQLQRMSIYQKRLKRRCSSLRAKNILLLTVPNGMER